MSNKITEQPFCQTRVMRGYFGLPFDFKLVAENGDIIFISNTHADFLTLSKLDLSKFKMQQFTGVFDRNKNRKSLKTKAFGIACGCGVQKRCFYVFCG